MPSVSPHEDAREGGPRILFALPFPPQLAAPHGGRVVARLVARLAERHRVAVVCIRRAGDEGTDEAIREVCVTVEEVAAPTLVEPGVWRNRAAQFRKLAGAPPTAVALAHVPGFAERLRAVAEEFQPTIVELEPHEMAQYLGALDGIPAARVVVEHDPCVAAAYDFAEAARGAVRLLRRMDASAWKRFARATAPEVDAYVTFTERDRIEVQRYAGSTPVHVIPVGGELPERASDPLGADPPSVLFVGGYRHVPNLDAALRLERTIFPAVQRRHPDATLELVGGDAPAEMREAAGPGMTLHGQVDSVAAYLDRAAVVAAPIRRGGGMRIKVLEALAAGRAVVASPLAAAGLEVDDGRELLLAETDEEFADAICLLLAEPERRVSLGRAARSWAENAVGWPRIVAAYETLYAEMEGRRGDRPSRPGRSPGSREPARRTSGRHRILVLAPFPPSRRAAHGGAKVVAELVDGLAAHHDVGLLYLERGGEQPLDPELAEVCVLVERVALPPRSVRLRIVQRLRLGARVVGGKPRWVVVSSADAFRTRLAEVVERFDPEVVQLEFVVMCDYLDALDHHRARGRNVVLTHHDPRARATREFTSGLRGIKRLESAVDARAWARFERRALARLDAVVVFTERDREGLLPLTATRIVRISPPQPVPLDADGAVGTYPPTLVFTGNFEHEPNEDAARHLVETIFPAVRAEIPEVRVRIVGANPSAALRRLERDGVEVTGFVAEVAPYVADAALVLAPIRTGGGMRVKVIDALSAGKAVVGTPRAFEGLDIVDGRDAVVVDGDEALAAACVRLLRDPAERERLGRNAHAWALAHVGSQEAVARYGALYDELLGR